MNNNSLLETIKHDILNTMSHVKNCSPSYLCAMHPKHSVQDVFVAIDQLVAAGTITRMYHNEYTFLNISKLEESHV